MADPLLEAARKEVAELLPVLEKDVRFRRYMAAQRLIRELKEISGQPSAAVATSPIPATVPVQRYRRGPATPGPRAPSRTSAVQAAATEYLRAKGSRAASPELLETMKKRGIDFPPDNELESLSSILSGSDLFDNVRGQGYGLVEWLAGSQPPSSGPVNGTASDHLPETGASAG